MSTKKGSFVAVRLTEEQKEMLIVRAEKVGMNVSEYIRYLILKALDVIK